MYNTTASYKSFIKKPSRTFESKVIIGNRTFTNSDIIKITPYVVQPSDGFSIGNTVSQSIDIVLRNDGGVYAKAGVADVSIGLNINGTYEDIPIGLFNIDDVEKTDYTVKITAYDNMIKFETAYTSTLSDTPLLRGIIEELADITGVEFDSDCDIPDYTLTKLEGYTCREILGYIAGVCGGNAYITRDGKFTIVYPHEVDCTITADNYIGGGYKLEDEEYKIGMITCQIQNVTASTDTTDSGDTTTDDSEDYDSANDKNTISAGSLSEDTMELTFENPYVTQSILNDILRKLENFSYLGYSLKWQGDLSLDAGDIITVIDNHGIGRKAYVFENKLNYSGGLTQETGAKGETKNSNSFQTSSDLKNVQRLSVKLLIAERAIIKKANITDLQATNARIENLDVAVATIDSALINYAKVTRIDAIDATIANLSASVANIDNALINKASIGDLNAANATISNLSATVANIQTLVSGNLTSANIQALTLTSDKVTVENGFIKNAMIESLDAAKINTGSLDTSLITVKSSDGSLEIKGATQQFKDSSGKIRLQLGQDTQGDFNFILRATDGTTTLIDGTGIKSNAIADSLIKNNMIDDKAITGDKINYSSFVSGFNEATNTGYINASKVAIDLGGQTLDVAFSKVTNSVNDALISINNIILGGRNYILASNFQENFRDKYWNFSNLYSVEDYYYNDLKYNSLVCNNTTNTWSEIGQFINTIEPNTPYTISAMCKGSMFIQFIEVAYDGVVNSNDYVVTEIDVNNTDYGKVSKSFTTSANARYGYLNIATLKNSISEVTMPKLEKGKVATDYTLAPEDVDLELATLKSVTETTTTSLSVIQGQISTLISDTTITIDGTTEKLKDAYNSTVSTVNSMNLTIGNHESTINTQTGQISSISSQITTIKADLESVKIDVSNAKSTLDSTSSTLASLQVTVNGINTRVESTETSVSNLTSSVSAINQTTDSINQTVSALQTTVSNKADTSTVTTVSNTVADLQTSVDGINSSLTTINSNVTNLTTTSNDNSDKITTITSNVSTLQSSVSLLQNQIALKVEQSNIDSAITTVNGRIDTTNSNVSSMQTSINLQIGSLTSSVSKSVNSTNLLTNPAFNNPIGEYGAIGTLYGMAIVNYTTYANAWGRPRFSLCDNSLWIRYDVAGDNYVEFKNLSAKVKPSTTYTLSYYYLLYSSNFSGGSSYIYERTAAQWNQVTYSNPIPIGMNSISNTWVRYTKTFTTQSTTDSIMLRFGVHGVCDMHITAIQLEEGSTATSWMNSAISVVGTSIIQSPNDVMTAFNGVSSYFKVNPAGATFGDVSTGDYTTVESVGLRRHIGGSTYDYFYTSYMATASISFASTDPSSKTLTLTLPDNVIAMFNGRMPICNIMVSSATGLGMSLTSVGASATMLSTTQLKITAYCKSVDYTYNSLAEMITTVYRSSTISLAYILMR